MKRIGHFSRALCLLIAAGLLFFGFGFFDAGKTVPHSAVAGEESIEEIEEEKLPENPGELCLISGSISIGSVACSVSRFTNSFCSDRILPVNPSGWLMPVRI